MTHKNKDKWAVVLGGSKGLGLASAKKLASLQFNICIVHRDRKSDVKAFQKEVEAMKSQHVEVLAFNQSALKKETLTTISEALPKQSVKVLLHSIAKGSLRQMKAEKETQLSIEDISITLHAMATSWYEWTQHLLNAEIFDKEAINIAFTSEGNTKVWPGYGAVSAAKATLEALMKQMAVEFAPLGMRTNCIQAGTTKTESFNMIPGSEKLAELAKKRNPFNRLTTPEDIANVVALLVSEEAKWINGSIIKADGGESLR